MIASGEIIEALGPKQAISLACIAYKSLEICERCRLRTVLVRENSPRDKGQD
jgi:hypothetical protein